ncbi:glycine cleavage system T protein [Microthyrium microscopicum]|uniref:Aminomethyltransferase n=1 Tax=Microthyrium microscopicum TaxID=703497 RepID=A0A6A6U7V5_9PEZI|nr:glycine cleavage system T protein [Microthyrium microscopicum]
MKRAQSSSLRAFLCIRPAFRPLPRAAAVHQPIALRSNCPTFLRHSRVTQASLPLLSRRGFASTVTRYEDLKKTPLYDLHVQHGGKMVEFGGHSMPVQYSGQSIIDSSRWTREKASVFDVSHMTQHKFVGPKAAAFLESISPGPVSSLKPFQGTYSAFLNENAGIVDDTIITNITEAAPTFHVVTNAGNYENNLKYLQQELNKFTSKHGKDGVAWEVIQNTGLVALQGPMASDILQTLQPEHDFQPFDLDTLTFGNSKWLTFREPNGSDVTWSSLVARTGYTGEDGFELSIPHPEPAENTTQSFTETILSTGGTDRVRLAGLGARDALRLEAGLCLHGHDINDTTTPLQASLLWIIPKARRSADAGFNGADKLFGPNKIKEDPVLRRVGMVLEGRGPSAREGDKVYSDAEGTHEVGTITSGAPGPTLGKNIAMGYVQKDVGKAGVPCWIKVRGKLRAATFAKMPFVPAKYFKGKA